MYVPQLGQFLALASTTIEAFELEQYIHVESMVISIIPGQYGIVC